VRGSIAALVGDTFEERTRRAFDSEDSILYSVAGGRADLYTFNTLEEAARFATQEAGLMGYLPNSSGEDRVLCVRVMKSQLVM
jgi:hypothetical protein